MYELRLGKQAKVRFVAVAKEKLERRGWTIKRLAAEMHRPSNSVYHFFSHDDKPNRFLAAEIANILNMKESDWRS